MVEEAVVHAVLDAVDPDEMVGFAQALIRTPSENPGGTEDAVAAVASDLLEVLGASPSIVRSQTGRPSVVARVGDGARPRLAWNGHLDVVPAGDPAAWSHAPFGAEVVGGRLIGRGAADMKGPIASALAAIAAIRGAGVELDGTLDLHLPPTRIHGLQGTKVLLERVTLDQDAAIVGEPTELHLGLAQRGRLITATARGGPRTAPGRTSGSTRLR
jgi:acetylornithine deacetylase/succinyl-diaminopimelate desuccinylase-like protein